MPILGTVGDDDLSGTIANDIFDLTQGGNDRASGLAGSDTFQFAATFDANDFVSGADGNDTVSLKGNYADGLTVTGAMVTSVEKFTLGKGFSYALTFDNSAASIGHTMTVDGGGLKAGDFLYLDATAETTSRYLVTGGLGNDVVWGGAANDDLDLSLGGLDEAHGGAGDDTIRLGAAADVLDVVDGGDGKDTLELAGEYLGLNALSLLSLNSIERLHLAGYGGFGYDITIGDESISEQGFLRVDARDLAFVQNVRLDISQVDGTTVAGARVVLIAGFEDDTVLVGGNLVAADRLDGWLGDDVIEFGSDTDVVLENGTVQGFETFRFAAGHDYSITMARLNIEDGAVLTVDASALGAEDTLLFDASHAKTGAIDVEAGAGNDVLTGGLGDDTFDLSLGGDDIASGGKGKDIFLFGDAFRASDSVDGGSDNLTNTVVLDGDYTSHTLQFTATTMQHIARLELHGTGRYDITLAAETILAGHYLTLDASAVSAASDVEIDARLCQGGITAFGHDGADAFVASQGPGKYFGMGGNDVIILRARPSSSTFGATLSGGDGDDYIFIGGSSLTTESRLKATDIVNGGNGVDNLSLTGDYSAALTFNATTVTNIETITVWGAWTYRLASNNATVAAGQVLTVDGAALTTDGVNTGTLYFTAPPTETDGSFVLLGGLGSDTFVGGALSDTLRGRAGADLLAGRGGADTFVYSSGASDSTGLNHDVITDINFSSDRIDLSGAITAIDAAASGAINSASFDADLATVVAGSMGGAGHAILAAATSGTLSGHKFLVIDQNGTAGYQSGGDLVIEVTGFSGTLATTTFI